MENQHRKISGYRELSQVEIDLMNEIKAKGLELQSLCDRVDAYITQQRGYAAHQEAHENAPAEVSRLDAAQPEKWASLARDGFQSNLMYLTRSVAQPTTF